MLLLSCCRLCKLFTNPITEVKDLAADFMFVLCKENGMYHRSHLLLAVPFCYHCLLMLILIVCTLLIILAGGSVIGNS